MNSFAYYNGSFGSREKIKIPLSDRAIFFGDGVYDAAIGKSGRIFLEEEHIDRLLHNAQRMKICHRLTHNTLSEILNGCIKKSGMDSFFLYFQLTRNSARRIHSATSADGANLLVTVDEFSLPEPGKKISLVSTKDLRYYYCDVKTLNLLPAVIASTNAEECGAYETVFIRGDVVTECAHSNISILKDGILKTHPTTNLSLPGRTRRHLLLAAEALGIEYLEIPFTKNELFSADEVIVTSTSKLLLLADKIDGVPVGGKDWKRAGALQDYLVREFVHYYL